ncbi:MAG: hypothetical protein HFI36_00145 [Bacilli bacterium]|jgi:CobQ-like glutamine amidotransferase family enzyme|nr:hypothetical protein [Bacilli bacterium]
MQVKIANLYPYELNLYGENGNIKALKYALEQKEVDVEIININPNDKINFNDLDFIYLGSGTKENLELVKSRLIPYRKELLRYISENRVLLVTGNALSILDFLKLYEIEETEKRVVSDVIATTSLCPENIYGFQNTEYLIKSTNKILFNINEGYGNDGTLMEGYIENNFYVTSIIGPLLARNPKLTNYFVDILTSNA